MDAIRRATFKTMREIMRVAHLGAADLPCLVVYLRSIDRPFVFSLQSVNTAERLVAILRNIVCLHDEVTSIPKPMAIDLTELERRVTQLKEVNREIDAKVTKIVSALRSLQRKYQLSEGGIEQLIARYKDLRFDDDFMRTLNIVAGGESAVFQDHRIPKILAFTDRLRELQKGVRDFTPDLREGIHFSEQMADLALRIETMQRRVANDVGASVGRYGSRADRLNRLAGEVDVWTSLVGKFLQAIDLLKHLFPPG